MLVWHIGFENAVLNSPLAAKFPLALFIIA